MNKSLILSAVLLLAGSFNINAEKSIEQLIANSDFNGIAKHSEITTGLTQTRKKHYLKLAQDVVTSRGSDTKTWKPYNGQAFMAISGLAALKGCHMSSKILLDLLQYIGVVCQDPTETAISIAIKAAQDIIAPGNNLTIESIKLEFQGRMGLSIITNSAASGLLATISAICFYKAYNYKQGFYRNAVAIRSLLENAPVIESTK